MPTVISRNAMTLATPVNELKFYYHVSDLIGNNYSPQAKSLNIKSLNEFNKVNETPPSITKSTLSRKVTQSVPDFLFTSSNHVNRVSPNKENSFSKSVKLPPIVDIMHSEDNGTTDAFSNILNGNCENGIKENSKNTNPSFIPQTKQQKLFKRRNNFFLDDDNETVTSVKSLGSNVNFSNHSGSVTSGISSKTHMSVNYGPSKYKIKRSQSFIYQSDYDNDSMFDTKTNGIETIEEQNEQLNDKKKMTNSFVKRDNLNSSKLEELFSILTSSKGSMKEKKKYPSRIENFSLKNRTSSISHGSNVNSKLMFHQHSVKQNPDSNHEVPFHARQNPKLDKLVLNVEFPPWFISTHGLTRPSSPTEESEQRYYFILNESIKDTMLAGVSVETINNIESRLNSEILQNIKSSIIDNFKTEIRNHYIWSMKKCILDYILKQEDEQKRLGIKLKYRVRN